MDQMTISESELRKYPAWKEALERFRAANFQYGDIITHEWLYAAFGMDMNEPHTPWHVASKTQIEFMANMEKFREAVQVEELLYLENERSQGYRVCPPSEQTQRAMRRASDRMEKLLKQTAKIVGNIRSQELTDIERRENMDARAKVSSIAGLTKRITAPF